MFSRIKNKLFQPLKLEGVFKGETSHLQQLKIAWSTLKEDVLPMTPCVISNSSDLKLSLVEACARQYFNQKVFLQDISKDSTIEDLFYFNRKKKILSPLMSAISTGQVVAIYPVGGMNNRCLAYLSTLTMSDRHLIDFETGKKIQVHKNFRLVILLNEEDFYYEMSREIQGLFSPKIFLDVVSREEFNHYLSVGAMNYDKDLLDHVFTIIKDGSYVMNLEDARNVLRFSSKIYGEGFKNIHEAVEDSINLIKKNRVKHETDRFFKLGL